MRSILVSLVFVGASAGCVMETVAVDTDADGLLDALEIKIGSDPDDPDTDDDGLLDGEEIELGTLPTDADTDDDGYSDRDELIEAKDPLDPSSVIYQGGWPYYFGKTELKGGLRFDVGKRFANLQLVDQFGDIVSLWDFYNEDRYVILDLCGAWCPICVDLGLWLSGEPSLSFDPWVDVRNAVDAGALSWVTLYFMDPHGEPPTPEDVALWAERIPHPLIPVLADPDAESVSFVELQSVPSLVLLAPNLKVHTSGVNNYPVALDAALDVLAGVSGSEP